MYKVSFDNYSKAIIKYGNITIYSIMGEVELPGELITSDILTKMRASMNVNIIRTYSPSRYRLYCTGSTKLHSNDKYDPILGERIAESKCKINLYKYMYNLLYCIRKKFEDILYGGDTIFHSNGGLHGAVQKYYDLQFKEEQHLNKLLEGVENGKSE